MEIRPYERRDVEQIIELHHFTVHEVNIKDYSLEQVTAWSQRNSTPEKSHSKYEKCLAVYVAIEDNQVICFGNLHGDGRIQQLYTHKDYQGRGAAGKVLAELEREGREAGLNEIYLESSLTAHGFYLKHGYEGSEIEIMPLFGTNFKIIRMKKQL